MVANNNTIERVNIRVKGLATASREHQGLISKVRLEELGVW